MSNIAGRLSKMRTGSGPLDLATWKLLTILSDGLSGVAKAVKKRGKEFKTALEKFCHKGGS